MKNVVFIERRKPRNSEYIYRYDWTLLGMGQ